MKKRLTDDESESYSNDDGLTVFTEQFLLSRGYCCGYGCRHCPYEYLNVKEPKRTILLQQRKLNQGGEK
ncbi:MAG: DUF5522 domain-containing protein [Flavitalea sp.]